MKKASLKIIICLLVVLALGTVLAACNKYTPDSYDFRVTFDYNEGISGEEDSLTKDEIKDQYIGVFKNGLVTIRPGYSEMNFPETSINGYYIEGWYTAQTDENGEPLVDEKGFVLLDKKWNFKTDRVTEDLVDSNNHFTLYANFQKQAKITFVDRATDELADTVLMAKPGVSISEPSSGPSKAGYTMFVTKDGKRNYYLDKEGTKKFDWPYKIGTEDVTVYVDYVEGENLNFVYTKEQFIAAINGNLNVYLMNDLDFTGATVFWAEGGYYNSELNGRGYTVTGLKRTLSASRRDYESKGGIFGTVGGKANIHDVTFANCDVSYTFMSGTPINWYVGLFAWKSEEGAKVENVKVTGKFSYTPANGGIIGSAGVANDEGNVNGGIDFSGVEVTLVD